MKVKIQFEENENGAVFSYADPVHYFMAFAFGLPATFCYFYFLVILPAVNAAGIGDYWFLMAAIMIYAFFMALTNAIQIPILNPHWIFSSMKRIIIKDHTVLIIQYGLFPICIRRRILLKEISHFFLVNQRRGRGLGFLYFFTSQANLYAFGLTLKNHKYHYLVDNEVRNGDLSEKGGQLAEHLDLPLHHAISLSKPMR